jgi:hypothetical protein
MAFPPDATAKVRLENLTNIGRVLETGVMLSPARMLLCVNFHASGRQGLGPALEIACLNQPVPAIVREVHKALNPFLRL